MKKKNLHGKLSLKIKDISALEGNSQSQIKGGTIGYLPCHPVTEYTMRNPDTSPCLIPSYDLVIGCTIGGSVPYCVYCAPTYMYQTCPDVPSCQYTCDPQQTACMPVGSGGPESVCVCVATNPVG